jgi:hypothetical protein
MQLRAKSAKNDLKPTNFLKRNFYFEMEGVHATGVWWCVAGPHSDQWLVHIGRRGFNLDRHLWLVCNEVNGRNHNTLHSMRLLRVGPKKSLLATICSGKVVQFSYQRETHGVAKEQQLPQCGHDNSCIHRVGPCLSTSWNGKEYLNRGGLFRWKDIKGFFDLSSCIFLKN